MKTVLFVTLFTLVCAVISHAEDNAFYDLSTDFLVWDKQSKTPSIWQGQRYKAYQNNAFIGNLVVKTVNEIESIACTHWRIEFENTPEAMGNGNIIAVRTDKNIRPQKCVNIDTSSAIYKKILREYLIGEGITTSVISIKKIIKTDLENDGVDEVLIEAAHIGSGYPPYGPELGHYSMIILRKLVKGKVLMSTVCGGAITTPYDTQYYLETVLDYDKDGINEVIISESAHEYLGIAGYKLVDNSLKKDIYEGSCVD